MSFQYFLGQTQAKACDYSPHPILLHSRRKELKNLPIFDIWNTEIDPRVIVLSFGWWFPERKDLELSGWKESNLNILTNSDPPYDPAIGSTSLRAVPCRIDKSETF